MKGRAWRREWRRRRCRSLMCSILFYLLWLKEGRRNGGGGKPFEGRQTWYKPFSHNTRYARIPAGCVEEKWQWTMPCLVPNNYSSSKCISGGGRNEATEEKDAPAAPKACEECAYAASAPPHLMHACCRLPAVTSSLALKYDEWWRL